MVNRVIIGIFTCIFFVRAVSAADGILWSNKQEFKLQPIFDLVESATTEHPLVFFLIHGSFRLADFSRLASVYTTGSSTSKIPSITSAIRSSKGYAGEWISEDLHSVLNGLDEQQKSILKYRDAADNSAVSTAALILVVADSLEQMDKAAGEVLEQLKHKSYRAILTGLPEESKREKRETPFSSEDGASINNTMGTYINGSGCILFTRSINILYKVKKGTKYQWMPIMIDPTTASAKNTSSVCSNITTTNCPSGICGTASFTLTYNGTFNGSLNLDGSTTSIVITELQIDLNIDLESTGYWIFKKIAIGSIAGKVNNGDLSPGILSWQPTPADQGFQMYSVANFAWACTETPAIPMTSDNGTGNIRNAMWAIQFNYFEVQPFLAMPSGRFTDNVDDCTGFFTIGIWMGIIVGLMMLLIFLYGIAMVTNLKTMDRFDDPKGKMLQINARE